MNKKLNKKGFTIVELVIVIAVIAILAAVMIPTFGSVIKKANMSAVQQEAAAVYKEAYALDLSDGTLDGNDGKDASGNAIAISQANESVEVKDDATWTYTVDTTDGTFVFEYVRDGYTATFSGADWSVTE